jgi:hypothetical protein
MSFKHILNEIENKNVETDEQVSRRDIFKDFGTKVALAALPLAIGSMFNKASAQTTDTVNDSLNLLLEMAYIQYNFYHKGNNTGNLVPPSSTNNNSDKPGFITIETQKLANIQYLANLVTSRGGTPFTPKFYNPAVTNPEYVPAAYDFRASGSAYATTFANIFSSYPTWLIEAQILEDTAVHAYQGQMDQFTGDPVLLSQMLQLQSTQARHAAHVRFVRRMPPVNAPEAPASWITNNIPPLVNLQGYYNGEDNVNQMGVDITSLPGANNVGTIPRISATAAFDEGYNMAIITNLIAPFKL